MADDIHITVNGRKRRLKAATTVRAVLETMDCGDRRVAVEVNRRIIPRGEHAGFVLSEGDRVEIVHAVGGG